ncbi:MAG: TPM domain-containing protein [Chlamydiia bacterium]|nr:TPM domain-containing protein [Chlamydiia bacterium]
MKHLARLLTFCLLFIAGAHAEQLPLHNPTSFVSDFAGVMHPARRATLERRLESVATQGVAEIAVVTLDSLGPLSDSQAARQIFDAWGIGKRGADNGVLILIAVKERRIRIETGYGIEGSIPDSVAGRIIRNTIAPSLRVGNWDEGIEAGVEEVLGYLSTGALPSSDAIPAKAGLVVVLALVLLPIASMICPKRKWWILPALGYVPSLIIGYASPLIMLIPYSFLLGYCVTRRYGPNKMELPSFTNDYYDIGVSSGRSVGGGSWGGGSWGGGFGGFGGGRGGGGGASGGV